MTISVRKVFLGLSWIPVALAMSDVFHVSKVDGSSMRPTLNPSDLDPHDWVVLKKFKPTSNLKVNDIVLLKSPFDPSKILCKRVKALSLDTIKCDANKDANSNDNSTMLIPRGHVWVEGDNIHSVDSRNFGPISEGLIVGKVLFIIWPPQRWKTKLDRWVGNNILIHSNNEKN